MSWSSSRRWALTTFLCSNAAERSTVATSQPTAPAMEVLLVDPLVPEALAWLQERHDVSFRPELADDPIELRKHTYKTRAIVLPPHVVVSQEFLNFSPKLQVVARMQVSSDNTDLDACARRGVRVVQARSATVR